MRDGTALEIRDGKLYAISSYTEFSAPILHRIAWLLPVDPAIVDVQAGTQALHDGFFSIKYNCGPYGGEWRTVRLPNGGATECEWKEALPVPMPKGKTEKRWNCGKWEKYNARKGWIEA